MRNTVAVSLAFAALLVAGCQRGGASSPTGTSAGNPTSPSASTAATPKNLVTPQTAGHPVLEVKLGEPVSLQKDGVTLTFTPKKLTKVDGTPTDLANSFNPDEGCGVWWQLDEEIAVGAKPGATWKLWSTIFSGFDALQKGTHGVEYSPLPVGASAAGDSAHPNDVQALTLANVEQQKNISAPFQKTITGKQYFGSCDDHPRSHKPSGLDPLGVELSLDDIRDGESKTTIARWLL